MSDRRLDDYRSKREGSRTDEPSGGPADTGSKDGSPQFVVQRHDATNLHFDFRLEIDGVLVSWAVPKGPSVNPSDKRLAHRTEDHPLDYVDYEGRIEGGYGAGTVIVWDTGPFDHITRDKRGELVEAADALDRGHLKVFLHGQKLAGAFALTHTRMGGDEANWMLVKVDDEGADRRRKPTSTQNESVLSGRSNKDLES